VTASTIPVAQCIGECMVELTRSAVDRARISYSGDTYNTAVYLTRVASQLQAPMDVGYLSGVGDDPQSDLMRKQWRDEGVRDDALIVVGRAPGMYLIDTDDVGERSFTYWRGESAAAHLFAEADWVENIRGDLVYLSGISLQLMPYAVRSALVARLRTLRAEGTRVAFDCNFRPNGWASTAEAADAMADLLAVSDVALVTLDDEIALGVAVDVASCAAYLGALGVGERVIKVGAVGAWVEGDGDLVHVPTEPVVPVDTTSAGDSFNGAYLAARLAGLEPAAAARLGNVVAGNVVSHRGAIIAAEHMPLLAR
jgi:2-dehydro-3-deoxygluconokinase